MATTQTTITTLDYQTPSPHGAATTVLADTGLAEAEQGELFPPAPRAHEYMRDPD